MRHMLMMAVRKCSMPKLESLNRTVQESCLVGCRTVRGAEGGKLVVKTARKGKYAAYRFLDCETFPNVVS